MYNSEPPTQRAGQYVQCKVGVERVGDFAAVDRATDDRRRSGPARVTYRQQEGGLQGGVAVCLAEQVGNDRLRQRIGEDRVLGAQERDDIALQAAGVRHVEVSPRDLRDQRDRHVLLRAPAAVDRRFANARSTGYRLDRQPSITALSEFGEESLTDRLGHVSLK